MCEDTVCGCRDYIHGRQSDSNIPVFRKGAQYSVQESLVVRAINKDISATSRRIDSVKCVGLQFSTHLYI